MVSSRKRKADSKEKPENTPINAKRTKPSSETSPKAGSPVSPSASVKPRKQRRSKEEIQADREAKEAEKQRVAEYKASLVPWEKDEAFAFPDSMPRELKVRKGDAEKQYKLNDKDMATLQYEEVYNPKTRHRSKVFALPKIQALAMRKHGQLPDTVLHELHYLDENFQGNGATITVPTGAGMRSRLDMTSSEAKEYRTRLTACLQQSVPDYDTKPENYTPPELGSTKDTLPANFAYRPATRRLTELEAMNLFLLRLHELDGLERRLQPDGLDKDHPKADCSIGPILYSGQTLNYEDVQQRAMDCHGGFESHNKMILQKAKKAVEEWKYGQWKPFPEELLARFALSPGRLKYKDWAKDVQDKSLLAVWWPPYDQNTDDFGAPELYAPGIGSD